MEVAIVNGCLGKHVQYSLALSNGAVNHELLCIEVARSPEPTQPPPDMKSIVEKIVSIDGLNPSLRPNIVLTYVDSELQIM
jgi:hypothetical protein